MSKLVEEYYKGGDYFNLEMSRQSRPEVCLLWWSLVSTVCLWWRPHKWRFLPVCLDVSRGNRGSIYVAGDSHHSCVGGQYVAFRIEGAGFQAYSRGHSSAPHGPQLPWREVYLNPHNLVECKTWPHNISWKLSQGRNPGPESLDSDSCYVYPPMPSNKLWSS